MNARRLEHLAALQLPLHGKTVLEVGAGIGDLTPFFLDRGCRVTSIEPRGENVEIFRGRYRDNGIWPADALRIVQTDAYRLADQINIPVHQIVFCYGLLCHLDQPERVLRTLAQRCGEMLLLETVVSYGIDDERLVFDVEDASDPTNSITGTTCCPSRAWVFTRLRALFEHVYVPLTQPRHDAFPLDWRHAKPPAGPSRATFIASRIPLRNLLLVPHIPPIQYCDLPQPGALTGLSSRGITLVDSIFGPVLSYEDDLITDQLRRFGAHTRNELAMLTRFVDEGDLLYDIGAHIGTFTLPLAGAVGAAGRVIAIEADASHFAVLLRNMESRGLARPGSALNVAIASTPGVYATRAVAGNSGATWLTADASGAVPNTARLDDVHRSSGEARRVALIKIDVEGMELSVLASAVGVITNDQPLLYVEVSAEQLARHGNTPRQITDFLQSRRYRLFRNAGERNAPHDRFDLVELPDGAPGAAFFDLLAIPETSPKLARALALVGTGPRS